MNMGITAGKLQLDWSNFTHFNMGMTVMHNNPGDCNFASPPLEQEEL